LHCPTPSRARFSRDQSGATLFDEARNVMKLGCAEAVAHGKRDWLKSELRLDVIARDVDVRRLVVFAVVKVETIKANAQHRWHRLMLRVGVAISMQRKFADG
jgi:hypothetical protein